MRQHRQEEGKFFLSVFRVRAESFAVNLEDPPKRDWRDHEEQARNVCRNDQRRQLCDFHRQRARRPLDPGPRDGDLDGRALSCC